MCGILPFTLKRKRVKRLLNPVLMTNHDSKKTPENDSLFICWTTVPSKEDGLTIANAFVNEGIAACVQLDGPISSIYTWEGKRCCATEYRLWLKVSGGRLEQARTRINELHPYDTPQWIETEATKVDEKYLIWVKEASNLHRFYKREPK